MKRISMNKAYCAIVAVYGLLLGPMLTHAFGAKTLFVPRSQSVNAARELIGWQREINRYDAECHYWSLSLCPEYKRSWGNQGLVDYLLGGTDTFVFSGSRSGERGTKDLLADYFGLPADFKSTVSFTPTITNFIFDVDFYMGLDSISRGLYFRIHAPIVHAKWDLNLIEKIENVGTAFHPAGYMAATQVPRGDLATSVEFALQGIRAQTKIDDTDPDETSLFIDTTIRTPLVYGDMHSPLAFGQISGRRNETRLSDVQCVVGWNFLQDSEYHCGLNVRSAIPTGTVPSGNYLFEPLVGNAHWELGFGVTSHLNVWRSHDGFKECSLYFDANITHLFASLQKRSFEFASHGNGSRYMLVEEMKSTSENLLIDGDSASHQYAGHLFPAINKTTLSAKIAIPCQADMVIKASLQYKQFEVDFGYNLWVRSAERLVCRDRLVHNLACKGDAQLYGFDAATQVPVALNATQSGATLHGGQGARNFVLGSEFANANIDLPALATNDAAGVLNQLTTADSSALSIAAQQVYGSTQTTLLTDASINNSSALSPRGITHTLFLNISHRWTESGSSLIPFLGVGFELEMAPRCFDGVQNSSIGLSQWGIVVKGGLSY